MGPKVIAQFGELHPKVLAAFDLKVPAAGFEIFLDAIPTPRARARPSRCSRLRPIRPSSAISPLWSMPKSAAGEIVKAVKLADRNLIDTVTVFDVYEGQGVPEGKKSVAVAVRIQPKDATLTEAEIDALAQKIVAARQAAALRSTTSGHPIGNPLSCGQGACDRASGKRAISARAEFLSQLFELRPCARIGALVALGKDHFVLLGMLKAGELVTRTL
jgi:hypothetical protein